MNILSKEAKAQIRLRNLRKTTQKDYRLVVSYDLLDPYGRSLIGTRHQNGAGINFTQDEAERFSLSGAQEWMRQLVEHLSLSNIQYGQLSREFRPLPPGVSGRSFLLNRSQTPLDIQNLCLPAQEKEKTEISRVLEPIHTLVGLELCETMLRNSHERQDVADGNNSR